jgi:hypothetical protein
MTVLYERLAAAGFVKPTINQQPSEWRGPSGSGVQICHVAGHCEIAYDHPPYHSFKWTRFHGLDRGEFVAWLARIADLIEEAESHRTAPGQADPAAVPGAGS